jgi:hypothetical protein
MSIVFLFDENPDVASGGLGGAADRPYPLALAWVSGYFPPAVARVYIVSFRTNDNRRPSKFPSS